MSRDSREQDAWWVLARTTIGAAFRAAFRVHMRGVERIPARGGALLVYNHVSVLDPVAVAVAAIHRGRRIRFLALTDDFARPFVGWILRRTDQIPLRRGLGDWNAIEAVADVLRRGSLAGMAPEGTVGNGTTLRPGQRGAARIALAAGVPVVPVAVWGTQARWPRAGPRWGRPVRPDVVIAVGRPIRTRGDPRSRADTIALTERMMSELGELVADARARARPGRRAVPC